MKFKKLASLAAVALATLSAVPSHAGVIAMSDLAITALGLRVATEQFVPFTAITILQESRNGAVSSNFNGLSASFDGLNTDIGGTVNSPLMCAGPDCASAGLADNSLAHITAPNGNYAFSDMLISGNAFGVGAPSGLTRAGVSIEGPTASGSSNSTIKNDLNVETSFAANTTQTVQLFVGYDIFVKTFVEALVGSEKATSNASTFWEIKIFNDTSGTEIFKWTPELMNVSWSSNGRTQANHETDDAGLLRSVNFDLIGGNNYTVHINQKSESSASDIPEPESLALVGLGLLGLVAVRRRKSV